MRPRTFGITVAVIFLLALGVRVGLAQLTRGLASPLDASAQPDQIDYEFLAYQLSQGQGYTGGDGHPTALRPPGTSFAILPIYLLFGRTVAGARLWFCSLSSLTCVITAYVARRRFGSRIGLLSGLLLALYPGHFYYPMHLVSEVPYGLFLVAACGLTAELLESIHVRPYVLLLSGLSWSAAILTRPQLIFVVPFAGLVVVARWRRMSGLQRRRLGEIVVVTLLLVSPWMLRNLVRLGRATISTVGGYTFWGANNDLVIADRGLRGSWVAHTVLVDKTHPLDGTEVQREAQTWRYGFDAIASHLSDVPALELAKVVRLVTPFEATTNRLAYWAFALSWLFVLPFAIYGMTVCWRQDSEATVILLLPILATVFSTVVFYGLIRFRDSTAPILAILAANGLAAFHSTLLRHAIWQRWSAAGVNQRLL